VPVSSSRITGDGRVIVTTGEDAGHRYIVLCETAVGFEPRGRPPTETEQATAKAPYQCVPWVKVEDRTRDDRQDEREALKAADLANVSA
jgi:hypothetical protein